MLSLFLSKLSLFQRVWRKFELSTFCNDSDENTSISWTDTRHNPGISQIQQSKRIGSLEKKSRQHSTLAETGSAIDIFWGFSYIKKQMMLFLDPWGFELSHPRSHH
jgi:hypothetical protein